MLKTQESSVVSYVTNLTGLARLKCCSVKALWVSSHIVSLSGDVEENPGPTNQYNENKLPICRQPSFITSIQIVSKW